MRSQKAVAELEPVSKSFPSTSIKKSRLKLQLTLQWLQLDRIITEPQQNQQARIIVLPQENTDAGPLFNETLPFAENDLAGNYGSGSKEAIKAFFGENMPIYKSSESPTVANAGSKKRTRYQPVETSQKQSTEVDLGFGTEMDFASVAIEALETDINSVAVELCRE